MSCNGNSNGGGGGSEQSLANRRQFGWNQQYVSELAQLWPDTEVVTRQFAYAQIEDVVPWWLRVWGRTLIQETDGGAVVGSSSFSAIVNGGQPMVPYKLLVTPDGGASPDSFLVDIGTGTTLMLPPSRAVRVDVVGPAGLQLVNADVQIPFPVGTDLFNVVLSVSLSAQECNVAQHRQNRVTRYVEVPIDSFIRVPIPERARFVWLYESPDYAGTPLRAEFEIDGGSAFQARIGFVQYQERQMIPGPANQILITGDADLSGMVVVFELEI